MGNKSNQSTPSADSNGKLKSGKLKSDKLKDNKIKNAKLDSAKPDSAVKPSSKSKSARSKDNERTKQKASSQKSKQKSKKSNREKEERASARTHKQRSQQDSSEAKKPKKLDKKTYEKELERLQAELVELQYWVKAKGLKVVVLFEGRDAAGKGGAIKRITECLNPRICRIVALAAPNDKEKGQWYFQRYVAQLPTAGEIVLFDRSWYNRAGVERVMGFCTHQEYVEFLRSCPEFEHMLQRSGIVLVKYWFSVSDEEQEKRFQDRLNDPTKRWKLSPMDLEARARWFDYSKAKDDMFAATDTTRSPWNVVEADDKRRARLNCINHLLHQIAYEDLTPPPMTLPPRQKNIDYKRPPMDTQNIVPDVIEDVIK